MQYKIGDTVRIRKDLVAFQDYGAARFIDKMSRYLGEEAKIEVVNKDTYSLDVDQCAWLWSEEMFEPVETAVFSKKDLQSGMFGETNDGAIFVVAGDILVFEHGEYDFLNDLEEDLNFKTPDEVYRIDRVVKDCLSFDLYKKGYGTELFSRLKPMTIQEVERELGYRIKLVEEKK